MSMRSYEDAVQKEFVRMIGDEDRLSYSRYFTQSSNGRLLK